MQDTLFALCGRDGDGSGRLWSRRPMDDGGRLRSHAALTLLHIAQQPSGPVDEPAGWPTEASAGRQNGPAVDITLTAWRRCRSRRSRPAIRPSGAPRLCGGAAA
jgi:hypothetical protein